MKGRGMRSRCLAGTLLFAFAGGACVAAPPQAPTVLAEARIDRWDPALDASVPRDWKVEKLAEGFGWAEGPLWVRSGGYLLFTDVPGNRMWKWSEAEGLEKFLEPSGATNPDPEIWREAGANGLASLDASTILLADTGNRGIQRLDLATKAKTPVAMHFEGRRFASPNDVTRMSNGVLFFTDPPYGFRKFDAAPEIEIPFNGVYRMGTDGTVTVIEKELHRPNGVALSPDERTLYVTQSEPTRAIVMAYTLDARGEVQSRRLFHDVTDLVSAEAPGLPDGLTVAADGTIFTSAPGGVLVLSAQGKRLGRIRVGKPVANCKFGDDGRTLYLTAQDMLARIKLNVSGAGF